MAAGNAIRYLQEETTCAVCLDFFHDPVMILSCGHNFCRRCLGCCSVDASGRASCPQCRIPFPHGGFRPNRQLANVVGAVRELDTPPAQELCRKHQQPLTLFSHRDGILVCAACAEHRAEPAVPLEEAARWYRKQFEDSLRSLQEEYEQRANLSELVKETRQEMLTRVSSEKQKLLVMTEDLRRVLSEQESCFLARFRRLCWRLEEQQCGEAARITWIQQHCAELQAKCQQPDVDLLRDAQTTLSRCTEKKVQPMLLSLPELEAELEDVTWKTNMLAEAVTQFKDSLGSSLEEDSGGYRRATVTLDPATAHPQILVSADGRTARRRESPPAPLPSGKERFESLCCVLGQQGFVGGRHCWAVEVRHGPDWALGVAREFVSRKGCFGLSPERGVWAVGQWLGQLQALTWPSPTCLRHRYTLRRIEVALDYAGGRVAFRDADSQTETFVFPPASFAGE
ncbi:zinc finger protein RFP-like isoform X2 [Myiozetetes cayanensis]|uniref:zinc finger protein RFP-like isoform X2 n=1 Tax=Myiozetetes cayanensis TaxID=478635 RepID=UPI00215FD778|nr:zinc finger protein RFP-like isoform X2 [Myiozetetes cayanensis]